MFPCAPALLRNWRDYGRHLDSRGTPRRERHRNDHPRYCRTRIVRWSLLPHASHRARWRTGNRPRHRRTRGRSRAELSCTHAREITQSIAGVFLQSKSTPKHLPSAMNSQATKANRFRDLHRGARALVLANVWDVASARIFEDAGFPALATTSAGIAFSLGYPDGQKISREEMIARVARIARAV